MHYYTYSQLIEARLLVFLLEVSLEEVSEAFIHFVEEFRCVDKKPELVVVGESGEYEISNFRTPWMLVLFDGSTILQYEGVYVGVFAKEIENETNLFFKNEEMMLKDENFDKNEARFHSLKGGEEKDA